MSPRRVLAVGALVASAFVAGSNLPASSSTSAGGPTPDGTGFLVPPAPGHDPGACGMLSGAPCYLLQWVDHTIEVLIPG